MDYEKYIGVTLDFPKKGISFKDVSPLLRDPDAFRYCIDDLSERASAYHPTVIVGPESRGFPFGAALAYKMGIGFVMARKAGKLPGETIKVSYALEYGEATLEVPKNSFQKGDRVLVIDDLMATGGTFAALEKLIRGCDAEPVLDICIIRLKDLEGEKALSVPYVSLLDL